MNLEATLTKAFESFGQRIVELAMSVPIDELLGASAGSAKHLGDTVKRGPGRPKGSGAISMEEAVANDAVDQKLDEGRQYLEFRDEDGPDPHVTAHRFGTSIPRVKHCIAYAQLSPVERERARRRLKSWQRWNEKQRSPAKPVTKETSPMTARWRQKGAAKPVEAPKPRWRQKKVATPVEAPKAAVSDAKSEQARVYLRALGEVDSRFAIIDEKTDKRLGLSRSIPAAKIAIAKLGAHLVSETPREVPKSMRRRNKKSSKKK